MTGKESPQAGAPKASTTALILTAFARNADELTK
jgi:hypothetical protein